MQFNKIRHLNTASIDRINSDNGYTIDNIQILHKKINRFKMAFPENELLEMCKGIVHNIKNRDIPIKISHWEMDMFNDTEYPVYFD